MSLLPTIGLEIHAELKTKTKMFCSSPNHPEGGEPNAYTCPVCLAHPGTLPVINKEAVRHVLRVGTALGGTLADYTEFDRKNYFYPDLPKGYQISQYEYPLVSGGMLNGVAITRVHLEEDTARSQHSPQTGATLIDYNRSGVPLMELVTEPVIHSAEEAGAFARELQLLLRYLGASDANMELGQMRVEANISVGTEEKLGTKVEIKNLNSFRSVERAIACEIERQEKLIAEGGVVLQETRGWDEGRGVTFAQRIKEGSADYRYFPDPDLPKLLRSEISEFSDAALAESLPELPAKRRERYALAGFSLEDASMLVKERTLGDFLDAVSRELGGDQRLVKIAGNYLMSDVVKIMRDIGNRDSEIEQKVPILVNSFAALVRMLSEEKISSRGAKDTLAILVRDGGEGDPQHIAEENNLLQVTDSGALMPAIIAVLEENPSVVAEFVSGKEKLMQFLVGQTMKATRGAGNPQVLVDLIKEEIKRRNPQG